MAWRRAHVPRWVQVCAFGVAGIVLLVLAYHFFVGDLASGGYREAEFASVESFDGHRVPITIYRPRSASAEDPVPVVLHSHGWAASRATRDAAFRDYTTAGLAVVSIDMRGHGDARETSESRLDSVEYEVRDVLAVIDYVAGLPWVKLEAPGDPVLGAIGDSYGGGYQLLTAALDPRLDAIAPMNTWNDLLRALAPNGVPKMAWIEVLGTSAALLARLHPDLEAGFLQIRMTSELPDGIPTGEDDLAASFRASSASAYPGAVRVPTLLIQGIGDTLFGPEEAFATYEMVRAAGAPVRLVTHLGGHTLGGPAGLNASEAGLPARVAGQYPCGDPRELTLAWHKQYLLGQPQPSAPDVCLALEDGTTVTAPSFPVVASRPVEASVVDLRVLSGNATDRVAAPLWTATAESRILGGATLRGNATTVDPDATVFWSLEVAGAEGGARIANGQVTPQRFFGPLEEAPFTLNLEAVAIHLQPGDAVRLVLQGAHTRFANPGSTVHGEVALSDVVVELPISCENPGQSCVG